MEVDDLTYRFISNIADVVIQGEVYIKKDAVRHTFSKESDLLSVIHYLFGYYPNDEIASRFTVAATGGFTIPITFSSDPITQVPERQYYILGTN